MSKELNVGIVGTKFMGRAHSNAYIDVAYFFDLPVRPVLRAACGRNVSDYDGLRCQQVLDATLKSAVERCWVEVPAEG
jgi:hypothetical protein